MEFDVASLLVWRIILEIKNPRNMLCWGHNAVKMSRGDFFFFFSFFKKPSRAEINRLVSFELCLTRRKVES